MKYGRTGAALGDAKQRRWSKWTAAAVVGLTAVAAAGPGWADPAPAVPVATAAAAANADEAATPAPLLTPPPPIKGVITLFSGKESEIAQNWLQRGSDQPSRFKFEDGAMVVNGGDAMTRLKFQDFQLHVEFRLPYEPNHHGQERANSGVYLQGRYEIQVLDSYPVADPGTGDASAVYNQAGPLVKPNRPPLEWQSYDIVFRAPRMDPDTHKVKEPARVSILFNGVAVQNNQEIRGPTGGQLDDRVGEPGPIMLQDHGHPVAYRNIWILPLPEHGANHY